jgi:hypothetical protein
LAADLQDRFDLPDGSPLTIVAPDGVDLERYTGLLAPQPARWPGDTAVALAALKPGPFTPATPGICTPKRHLRPLALLACQGELLIVGGEPQDVEKLRQHSWWMA